MPETPEYTLVLSGPLARKTQALTALDRVLTALGPVADLSEPQATPDHWPRTYRDDDPSLGWLHCRSTDVDAVAEAARSAGWRLRAHWQTPPCQACQGTKTVNGPNGLGTCLHCGGKGVTNIPAPDPLRVELDELRARLAALEARS